MDYLLLLLLGILWGLGPILAKIVVAEVPVFTLVGGRLTLAAAVMWLFLRLRGQSMPRDRRSWMLYAGQGIFNAAIPFCLISWAVQTIPGGLAALLQATTPIFTLLLAHFFAGAERLTPSRVAGVLLGFAGVLLQMLPTLRPGLTANVWSQLAVILACVLFGAMAIVSRRFMLGQPPLQSATGTFTAGALFLWPFALFLDRPFALSPSLPVLAAWLALALLASVVARTVYFTIVNRTSATFVTMVMYILPVTGLIVGAILLGEPLSLGLLLSLALILLGIFLVNRPVASQGGLPGLVD